MSNQRMAEQVVDSRDIALRVLADINRPCLRGPYGPCFHLECLESHYETIVHEDIVDSLPIQCGSQ